MIVAILRASWLGLRRDRVAQLVTFVLPVAFFSLMTIVFGGTNDGPPRVELAVVDEDRTEVSRRFVAALLADGSLEVRRRDAGGAPLTRERARALVSQGDVTVAAVLRPGFAGALGRFGGERAGVDLFVDTSDPVAVPMVTGLLQRAAMSASPDLLLERALGTLEDESGAMTERQRQTTSRWLTLLRASAPAPAPALDEIDPASEDRADDPAAGDPAPASPLASGALDIEVIDLLAEDPSKSPVNAFYAAGIAVLFLLFTCTATAGSLLEEEQNGTLERLLSTDLTMGQLLAGRWLFATLLGCVQVTLMFVWGALIFEVELFTAPHLAGFAVMTLATTGAASGFGVLLATLCRTRAQLDGIGTLVILVMSAAGGSMFPRFLMPDWMKDIGLATFNAWALDGYQKVFWYETPLFALWPQVVVLAGLAAAFLFAARQLARRWEAD